MVRLLAYARIAVQFRALLAGILRKGLAGSLAIKLSGKRSFSGSNLPPNISNEVLYLLNGLQGVGQSASPQLPRKAFIFDIFRVKSHVSLML